MEHKDKFCIYEQRNISDKQSLQNEGPWLTDSANLFFKKVGV